MGHVGRRDGLAAAEQIQMVGGPEAHPWQVGLQPPRSPFRRPSLDPLEIQYELELRRLSWRLRNRLGFRHKRPRSEEHTSELQSLMRISYAVFCLIKKQKTQRKSTPVMLQQRQSS